MFLKSQNNCFPPISKHSMKLKSRPPINNRWITAISNPISLLSFLLIRRKEDEFPYLDWNKHSNLNLKTKDGCRKLVTFLEIKGKVFCVGEMSNTVGWLVLDGEINSLLPQWEKKTDIDVVFFYLFLFPREQMFGERLTAQQATRGLPLGSVVAIVLAPRIFWS